MTIDTQEALYDRSYYEGRVYVGEGYRDFLWHQFTVNEILKRKPDSVIEAGCGRGYIVKHLIYNEVDAVGFDASEHTYNTRASRRVYLANATNPAIWSMIGKKDMCFSMAFLEHVKESLVPVVIKNMIDNSNFGLHGITFEDPLHEDPTHVTLKPRSWWYDQFQKIDGNYPVEIYEKTELERPPPGDSIVVPMGKIEGKKINFGSHISMFYYGWLNVDIQDLSAFAKVNGYDFMRWDIRRPLPFEDNSVTHIVAQHTLEHLTFQEVTNFLIECYRILAPGGMIRIGVPDLEKLINLYLTEHFIEETASFSIESEKAPNNVDAFFNLLSSGHRSGYNKISLFNLMNKVGFYADKSVFDCCDDDTIRLETIDSYPKISCYVDGIKPKHTKTSSSKPTESKRGNAVLRRS